MTQSATIAATTLVIACLFSLVSSQAVALDQRKDGAVTVNFPKKSVGQVVIRKLAVNPQKDSVLRTCEAVGTITVPAKCGIDIVLNYQGSTDTSFLRSVPPQIVRRFNCSSLELTDDSIKDVALLTNIVELDLEDSDLTDKGAQLLRSLTEMRKLNMGNTLVTARGLSFLPAMKKLTWLRVSRCKLGDAVAPQLDTLTTLESLDLCGTQITDKTMPHLSRLVRLKDLNLRRNNISNRGINSLIKLNDLGRLDLTDTLVTVHGLVKLADLPNLHALVLRRHVLNKQELARLKQALPRVTIEEGSREVDLPRDLFAPLK